MNTLLRLRLFLGVLAVLCSIPSVSLANRYVNQKFADTSDLYVVEGKTLFVPNVDSYCQVCFEGTYDECGSNVTKYLNLQNLSSPAPYAAITVGGSGDFSVWTWSMSMNAYYAFDYTYSIPTQVRSGNQGNRIGRIILSNPCKPVEGIPDERTFYILENSAFQVGVVATNYSVLEGKGSAFRFYRTGHSTNGDDRPVKLTFQVAGNATLGSDYTSSGLAPESVTIPKDDDFVDVAVTTLTDTLVEGAETIIVTLNDDGFGFVTGQQSAALVIQDDYPTINLQATDRYADRSGANPGMIQITRSGRTNQAVTVQLSVGGTAVPGTDYAVIPTNITLAAGVVQSNLAITPIAAGVPQAVKTVVAGLKTNAAYFAGLYTNAVVTLAEEGPKIQDSYPTGERYLRGGGTNLAFYSMVIPLDDLKGTQRADVDPASLEETRFHYDGSSGADQSWSSNRISFNTPIASFGSAWGTPLYLGQSYSIGVYCGWQTTAPVAVMVYRRSDGVLLTNVTVVLPSSANTNDWADFATNGFARGVTGYGLTTVLRKSPYTTWGTGVGGFVLTHTASDEATNYLYMVRATGTMNGLTTVLNGSDQGVYGYMYDLNFEPRPAWRSVFLDQPHFQSDPLPPHLWNKTPEELHNYGATMTNMVGLSPAACTNLDHSPELRRHPTLDQFVADLNSDPIALANYVQNEIELTDAVAYRDDGSVESESINAGGVNRGALGVYLEGQGSPVEQCALLVYLLRKAGYPATYVFPPDGGLKLLDTRLSALLRMRINGAQDFWSHLYTTNRLITVNYPWVAVHIGTGWVHLFPWIKDTQVVEGLDLYDYLPTPYQDSQLWVRDYVLGKTNIMTFATLADDTPRTIFPRFLDGALKQNAPGVSVDDIGMRFVNRRHLYSQWSDFPRPTWATNLSTAVESLASTGITNVSPALTNVFDTVSVELFSVNNPQKKVATPDLRMADLHNRKFFILHTNLGGGQFQSQLILGAYRPGSTSMGSFSPGDATLTNKQMLALTLDDTDDNMRIRLRARRQRALNWDVGIDENRAFLNLGVAREVVTERPWRKGDVAGICLNVGRVTRSMLRVHQQELWDMEQKLSTNAAAAGTISPDVYQGSLIYLTGMDYYWRTHRFNDLANRLYKVSDLSHMAMGLTFLSPHRTTNGLIYLTNGVIDPMWPKVDMFFQETARAGNGSVRLDSGRDWGLATRDCANLQMADLSAQEHATLNWFFGRSNSVSTVKLLQLAQAKTASGGSNVVELNYYNHAAEGNRVYAGKALKDHDPALWASVVGMLQRGQGYAVAWIPPGSQTTPSGSFSGMAALVLGVGESAALIGNNLNGAFADPLKTGAITTGNLSQHELRENAEHGPVLSTTEPTASTKQAAPESTATFDATSVFAQLNNNSLLLTPQQVAEAAVSAQLLYGINSTYPGLYSVAYDRGPMGPSDYPAGNSIWGAIADPVNTMSGEFYVDEVDLALPGPMPLQVRRNYSSHNQVANQLGFGWKLNYMPYLTVAPSNNVIYAAEPDGAVLAFGQIGTNLWAPTPALNPDLNNHSVNGIGSVANHFNARLAKVVAGSVTNYFLTNGDGSLRVFEEMKFPLTNSASWDRQRPYLTTWQDNRGNHYRFEYGTNAALASHGQVRRIVSSSGNILRFEYDPYGRVVDAYSLDGRRVQYEYDGHGDLVGVTRPDMSEIRYEYDLRSWTTNGLTNVYSTHLLVNELKPDGRVLRNAYDDQRRVTNQWATAGPDLRLVRNATFLYTNNFKLTNVTATLTGTTTVLDYTNNPTTYFYTNSLIRRIRDPLGAEVVQTWFEADETNAPAHPRSLKTLTDKRGLVTSFLYDGRGNVTNTTVRGDLLGDGNPGATAVTVSLFNANNLPVQTVDAGGTTNLFFYTNTWLLARQEIWPANATPAQAIVNLYEYASVTNQTQASHGLRVREVRAAGTAEAVTNEWDYSARGFPTRQVRHTGTADPAVIVTNLHNYRGELALQQDAAGRVTRFSFDPLGRPQSREVFDAGAGVPLAWDYTYYNENGEVTWTDGPRYNPEDYVWRDYDGAGRQITEIRWRSQAKADGTGVEAPPEPLLYAQSFQQFDAFGNLVWAVNPQGVLTTSTWDALGQLVGRKVIETNGAVLTSEGFAYEPGGLVTRHTNALGGITETLYTSSGKPKYQKNPDGSTNGWRYFADGRVWREIQRNGAYWETTYDDALRRTTKIFYSAAGAPLATNSSVMDRRGNVVVRTDANGNSFTNAFDGLNRLKFSAGPVIVFENPPGAPPPPGGPPPPLQQAATNFYDAAGIMVTNLNAAGEKTITRSDALGRTTRTEIRNAANALVRESTTVYTANHHGVTVTNGSGSGAIASTRFTDTLGNPVLDIGYPTSGHREFTRREFDAAGNLTYEERDSAAGAAVTAWRGAVYSYDGLNRVTATVDRDDALTTFARDAMGNLTHRTMPGGLQWRAEYNSAGQLLKSWNLAPDNAGTRTNTYTWFGTGSPFAGLTETHTDGRGVVCAYAYDDFLRPVTNSYSGSLPEHNLISTRKYDARGAVTEIGESFAAGGTGPATVIGRAYDPYAQLAGETVRLGGVQHSAAGQQWNSVGRRTALNFFGFSYNFGWFADGQLSSLTAGSWANGSYGYSTAGLLNTRTMNGLSVNVTSRDGVGRITARTSAVNSTTRLAETLSWTGDGLLAAHTLAREDFTDYRNYDYATLSRRLAAERLKLDATKGWTNVFGYDEGEGSGPGVLTRMAEPQAGGAEWTATLDGFNRIERETNNVVKRPAQGRLNAVPQYGTVSVALDGRNLSVNTFSTGDASWPTEWRTEMELRPGPRTLTATARHGSGMFTTNASVTFTNNAVDQTTVSHFAEGQLSHRIWRNSAGETNRVQTFTWDARSRMIGTTELDANNNGYNWSAVYDGLGRRLQTTTVIVTNGVALTNQPKVIASYFDPNVEFLELGLNVSGKARWKVYGPDLDGRFGGMNGTGGLDGVVDDVGVVRPVVSDARGNVHGVFDTVETEMQWNTSRPTGYGAVPEYRPLSLADNGDLGSASAWRGRWPDRSGLYWLGARYYDPVAGRFISCDPYGHDADPSLYAFADGDPINRFDPDGRLGKGTGGGYFKGDFYQPVNFAQGLGQFIGQVSAGLTPYWGQVADIRDTAAAGNAISTEGLGWGTGFGMAASVVAWVPGVGDALKGLGKGVVRLFDDVPTSSFTPPPGGWMPTQSEFSFVPFVERQTVALDFFAGSGVPQENLRSFMNAVDFNSPVNIVNLPAGMPLTQFRLPDQSVGRWFTTPGTPANTLGIYSHNDVLERGFTVGSPVRALDSTAASTIDTWSVNGWAIDVQGGGRQFYIPDRSTLLQNPPASGTR